VSGHRVPVADLVSAAAQGSPRAVARLISLIENDTDRIREVVAGLVPASGRAHVVGLTGPPGVGKSTTTSALVTVLRAAGLRVAVLAVDPSSPFTGGALLGDRVRMQVHAADPEVFIRSMASRGHLGGLAAATIQALRVFDLAGCDVTLVETVGVGQSEIDVAAACDSCVVLLAPGMGDGIQAAKAGIIEIADVFVANKADRDGTPALVRELRNTVGLPEPGRWRVPIVKAVATSAEGIAELWQALVEHRSWSEHSGAWRSRRLARAAAEVQALAFGQLRRRLATRSDWLAELSAAVRDGTLDPYAAADRLVDHLANPDPS
jgi:LAO/AO transport system kinase